MPGSSIDASRLATCLQESSTVKCVFLNTCNSKAVADHLNTKGLVENVLFLSSNVDATDAFYHYLCMNGRENSNKFEDTFDYAKMHVDLRNFF